jgi:hypothetical protein
MEETHPARAAGADVVVATAPDRHPHRGLQAHGAVAGGGFAVDVDVDDDVAVAPDVGLCHAC